MNTAIDKFIAQSGSNQHQRLLWLAGEGWRKQDVIRLVAAIALVGTASIISGSDWVPGYQLAHEIRRHTTDVKGVLKRLSLARAFTCYQVADLLETVEPGKYPIVVLDLLCSFYDPDIHLGVRLRVLEQSIRLMQGLSKTRPVAVLIQPSAEPDYGRFFGVISSVADDLLQTIVEPQKIHQPTLLSPR